MLFPNDHSDNVVERHEVVRALGEGFKDFAPAHDDPMRHPSPTRMRFLGFSTTRIGKKCAIYECRLCGYCYGFVPHLRDGSPHLLCKGNNLRVVAPARAIPETEQANFNKPVQSQLSHRLGADVGAETSPTVAVLPPWIKRITKKHWDPSRHWLPGVFRFVGESRSRRGEPVAIYECSRCGHTVAVTVDRTTGAPMVLFEKNRASV